MNANAISQTKSGHRMVLLGLCAIFALPVLIAIALQTKWFRFTPSATKNNGELIQPAVLLPALAANANDATPWRLLYVTAGDCTDACAKTLDTLLRVRETQGRNAFKVNVTLVASKVGAAKDAPKSMTHFLPSQIPEFGTLLPIQTDLVVMVDPRGYAMMRYVLPLDASGVRKDLAHLLKYTAQNNQ
jgi:hypothetical protein